MSPWRAFCCALQFNHSSLFNQPRQNWADPMCALRSLWHGLKHRKSSFQKHATGQKMWGILKSSTSVTAAQQRSAWTMWSESIEAFSISLCRCTGTKFLTMPLLTPIGSTKSAPAEVMVGMLGSLVLRKTFSSLPQVWFCISRNWWCSLQSGTLTLVWSLDPCVIFMLI